MSGAKPSVLAQKIESANSARPGTSNLDEFRAALAKAAEEALGDLLSEETEVRIEGGDARLPEALAEAPDPGVYYWLVGKDDALCAFAQIAPEFAAMLSERLLGGDLGPPAEIDGSSILDFEMAGLLVDALLEAVNQALSKQSSKTAQDQQPIGRRGARSAPAALSDVAPMRAHRLTIAIAYGGHEAPAAIRLFFPVAFLENAGLAGNTALHDGQQTDGAWTRRMRNTVLHTQLPLAAVVGRIRTSVGELSRLQIGQEFELKPDAINSLEVTAATHHGPAVIAWARLGAYQTNKAMKLTTPIDPDFIRDL